MKNVKQSTAPSNDHVLFCRVVIGCCLHDSKAAVPMKNRDLIISNLRESICSLETIIGGLKTGFVFGRTKPLTYGEGNFRVDLEHAYHHMNFAWHIRNIPHARAVKCAQADFEAWSKFPFDIESD